MGLEDRYELGRLLGEGATATVRAATVRGSGAAVAIKFLDRQAADIPQARERFQQEIDETHTEAQCLRHDPTNLLLATMLAHLDPAKGEPVPVGTIYQVDRPTYDDGFNAQLDQAVADFSSSSGDQGDVRRQQFGNLRLGFRVGLQQERYRAFRPQHVGDVLYPCHLRIGGHVGEFKQAGEDL